MELLLLLGDDGLFKEGVAVARVLGESLHVLLLVILVVIAACLHIILNNAITPQSQPTHHHHHQNNNILLRTYKFKANYLTGFLTARAADWMQGPYAYALYSTNNLPVSHIAALFLTGYISGSIFGPFTGLISDSFGRKKMCLAFAVFSGAFAVLMLRSELWLLLLGRLCSGIASTILHSSFEAWMIREFQQKEFLDESVLSEVFQLSTTWNGIIAIFCGISSSFIASRFGLEAPYLASVVLLSVMFVHVLFSWKENYGDTNSAPCSNFEASMNVLSREKDVLLVGAMQISFETAMYLFVFLWTPSLRTDTSEDTPLGIVFASFMVSITIGSSLFGLAGTSKFRTNRILIRVFILALCSLTIPIVFSNHTMRLLAFCLFEVSCGAYYPSMGKLRQKTIPEAQRSTIMTLFRIPLNICVATGLFLVNYMSQAHLFLLSSAFLGAGIVFEICLNRSSHRAAKGTNHDGSELEMKI